jgi:hypothetical protein
MAPQAQQMGAGGPPAPQPQPAAPPVPLSAQGGAPASPLPPGAPVTIDGVMRLLRDNPLRRFRIDIEADSTIAGDEAQEKADRSQFIESITKMVQTWGPIVTAQPIMAPLAAELMQFGVRAFRVGRSLEQVIEETAEKFQEAMGQPKPPPQPSPDDLVKLKGVQIKTQAEIQKAQIGVQAAQIDAQARVAAATHERVQGQQDHVATMAQGQQQAQLADQAARNEAASNQMKAEVEIMRFRRAVDASNAPDKTPKDQ